MARRRSRRSSRSNGLALVFVALMVLAIGSAVIKALVVLVPVLAAGGVAVIAWKVHAARKRRADLAEYERIRAIRSREAAAYHQMSATQFEHALAYLCRRDGCPEAIVTGRAGDFGADVIAVTPDGRKLVIQAKRYVTGNNVSGPDVQKFAGTCRTIHQADIAALVTTSSFTKQARDMAAHARILLYDADALGGWASGTGPSPWRFSVPLQPANLPEQRPAGRHARPERSSEPATGPISMRGAT